MESVKQAAAEPTPQDYKNGWAHFEAMGAVRRIQYKIVCQRRDLQALERELRAAVAEEKRLGKLVEQWKDIDVMPEPGAEREDKDENDNEWL